MTPQDYLPYAAIVAFLARDFINRRDKGSDSVASKVAVLEVEFATFKAISSMAQGQVAEFKAEIRQAFKELKDELGKDLDSLERRKASTSSFKSPIPRVESIPPKVIR